MLEFFESLNDTRDFLLWNSEQETGEWLLLRKWFGTFFTSKWLFSWMSPRWVLRLPDSENDLEHSLQGRGRRGFFWKWLFPENSFSPKMASPRKWLLPENGFSGEITFPQEIQNTSHFNLISFWHYFGRKI